MTGVVFEVYDKDGTLVDTVTTGSDGHAKTKVLPYGRYTLLETRANSGYALADKTTFSIYIAPAVGQMISEAQMTVEDQKMAQVEVFKVTSDGTQTPMNGVVFGVFDAKTNLQIASITTDKDGHGVVYVLAGNYYLQEISTWAGYQVAPDKIPLSAEYAHLYTFRETNDLTTFLVSKESTTGVALAGMQFTLTNIATGQLVQMVWDSTLQAYIPITVKGLIYDPAAVTTTAITGADGTVHILGLNLGDYLVTEIAAPDGYNNDSKPTTVTLSTPPTGVLGASIIMRDSVITLTPKTGETDNDISLFTSGMALLLGACLTMIILQDRRRKREY